MERDRDSPEPGRTGCEPATAARAKSRLSARLRRSARVCLSASSHPPPATTAPARAACAFALCDELPTRALPLLCRVLPSPCDEVGWIRSLPHLDLGGAVSQPSQGTVTAWASTLTLRDALDSLPPTPTRLVPLDSLPPPPFAPPPSHLTNLTTPTQLATRTRKQGGAFRRKLVIVGDGACGKTSLLSVFSMGEFPRCACPVSPFRPRPA